jgi:opacity protein-like surface antigen
MSSRSDGSARQPVAIALCLMAACLAVAVLAVATAHAAEYKAVNCAVNSGAPRYTVATNTTSPQNPPGIFSFENDCINQGGDPPGNASFLRISEHEPGGNAGYGAYLNVTFETPSGVNFRSAGGYTREPNAFNDGWQARLGFNYMDGAPQLQMVQGAGLQGVAAGYFGTTSTFAPHLWPWPYAIDFYRCTFQMLCARAAGCDRSNYNAVDLNGIVFTLRDWQDSQVGFTNTGSDLLSGRWVKGPQNVTWQVSEQGSGIRMERLRVDGAERWSLDHGPECDTSYDQTNGGRASLQRWRSAAPTPTATSTASAPPSRCRRTPAARSRRSTITSSTKAAGR